VNMSERDRTRIERLCPNYIPRYVRCYDNGGETHDRYTVCYTGRAATERCEGQPPRYPYVGMSERPYHPQGFGQHGSNPWHHVDSPNGKRPPAIGRTCRLGKRIRFTDLPIDCQNLVLSVYIEIWRLSNFAYPWGGENIKNFTGEKP
jgi:hypothetical protein